MLNSPFINQLAFFDNLSIKSPVPFTYNTIQKFFFNKSVGVYTVDSLINMFHWV